MKKLTTALVLVAILLLASTAMATTPLFPTLNTGGMCTVDPNNPALIATNVYAGHSYNIIIDTSLQYTCWVAIYYADGRHHYMGSITESKRLHVAHSGTLILIVTPRYGYGQVITLVELAR